MIKVYSFDVFDTSLLRRVASPRDAFALVAHRAAHMNGESAPEEWVRDFVAARIEARRRADWASGGRECTLEQIWEYLHELLRYLPETCGAECEIAVERDLLAPNYSVASRIAELRARSARIVFTTDTYLPEVFIRSELIRHGLAQEGDGFYVSSAMGARKDADGRLFDILLREENVAAQEVHHLGDNLIADVRFPRRRGIHATWFTGSLLNPWERAIVDHRTIQRQPAATLAGAMRAARLAPPCSPVTGVHELVSTFLGPALTLFAAWVLGAAQRDKVSRLYFCSRDCYLLWRAARVLAPSFNDIDCRYLKISRRTVFVPSVFEFSRAGMAWMGVPGDLVPLHKLVQKAGLYWAEVEEAFSAVAGRDGGNKVLATDEEADAFWRILLTPPVVGLLEQRVHGRRESAVAYLASQGLLEPVRAAIVDLGWTATALTALNRILYRDEAKDHLYGYYLCLTLERRFFSSPGKAKALFYEEPAEFTRPYAPLRRASLLSEVFGLAPHGTALEYRMSDDQPAVICADVPSGHIALVEQIADAVEAFCAEQARDATCYAEDDVARSLLEALVEAWCASPHEASLRVLQVGCQYARDPGNPWGNHPAALIVPWRLSEAIKNLVPGRLRRRLGITVENSLWPEASLLCSERLPANLVRLRDTASTALRRH